MFSKSQFIMLIDDNIITLESVSEALELHGFNNHMYSDPLKAIAAYDCETYPIIIVDYNMPKMNGIEVLEKIRRKNDDAQVIIYTGSPDERIRRKIIASGADDFYKISDIGTLFNKLKKMQNQIWRKRNED